MRLLRQLRCWVVGHKAALVVRYDDGHDYGVCTRCGGMCEAGR